MQGIEQILHELECAAKLAPLSDRTDERVQVITVAGEEAFGLWRKLHRKAQQLQHWPILLGDASNVAYFRKLSQESSSTVQEILIASRSLDPDAVLHEQVRRMVREFFELNPGEDFNDRMPAGEWPTDPMRPMKIRCMLDPSTRKRHTRIAIAFVPTLIPWEVPAYLRLGGWNECPATADHCTIHRLWNKVFGAEMIAATTDMVELGIRRRPSTRETAIKIATQHFFYCPDIVDQGFKTISALAATLLESRIWSFWWD